MLKEYEKQWFRMLVETDKADPKFAGCVENIYLALIDRDEEVENLKKELALYKKKLKEEVEQELAIESTNPILKVPILECGLPYYIAKDLWNSRYEFENLGEVLKFTRKELLSIRGFGGKRLAVLEGFLEEHGLKLEK
jgi:hypothetical protein